MTWRTDCNQKTKMSLNTRILCNIWIRFNFSSMTILDSDILEDIQGKFNVLRASNNTDGSDFELGKVEEACPFEVGNDFIEGGWIILQSRWTVKRNFTLFLQKGEVGAGK